MFGAAETSYDIKSFLQLGTLIVFSSRLQLGGFEAEAIADASHTFRDELVQIGLKEEALSIRATTEAEFRAACIAAARHAASDMPFGYRQGARSLVGLSLIDLPRGAHHRGREITRLVTEAENLDLIQIAVGAFKERSAGAVNYMLAISPGLRKRALHLIAGSPGWGDDDSFELEGYLRAVLNTELARLADATYAPAPSRAELIERENELAIELLQAKLDEVIGDKRPRAMKIPPVTGALLVRSHGDPKGFIEQALEMRELARPLREHLAELARAAAQGSLQGQEQLFNEIDSIGEHLRIALRVKRGPDLLRAIDLDVVMGLPGDASLSTSLGTVKNLVKWAEHLRMRGKLVVLTEIVRQAAFASTPRRELHKLAEAATGRALEAGDPILKIF